MTITAGMDRKGTSGKKVKTKFTGGIGILPVSLAVCLYHLLACLRARVSVFFWNRIENYSRNGAKGNRYTWNMQEMKKNVTAGIGILTVSLAVFLRLSRSSVLLRARLHVCLFSL
jgi:hypothetical protein